MADAYYDEMLLQQGAYGGDGAGDVNGGCYVVQQGATEGTLRGRICCSRVVTEGT